MLDVLLDSALDLAKTLPVLALVYALLYWVEHRMRTTPALLSRAARFGPLCGALAGLVPQCGFSAAASALFLDDCLAPATLVAVFLATSDEALPVLFSSGRGEDAIRLLVVKLVLAAAGGYLLRMTVLRRQPGFQPHTDVKDGEDGCACCCGGGLILSVLGRTVKTAFLLLVVLVVFNCAVFFVGEERISALLLSGSTLQPILCATLGLIPSCAVSVLLAELYSSGAIGFGSMVAGLSTGAGFGYMVLCSDRSRRRAACGIIALTWVLAAAGGVLVLVLLG